MKKQERGGEYMKKLWELAKGFAAEEDAVGVVEIILILVVLIGLVIIFKEQLTSLVKNSFKDHETEQFTLRNSPE